jgi:hypothetical protein
VPFFIAWGEGTSHPSQDSPAGCTLTSLRIEHTEPDRFGRMLAALGVAASIEPGARSRLIAGLETSKGLVELS